jgi:gliding motility-associated-like protein
MDVNGCSDVISTLVNVNPNPIVSLSPSSADICNGASVNITAFGADNYTWHPVLGLNTSSGNSVSANPNTSITYSVDGTDNNNCSSTTIFQLNVGINPSVSVSPSNPIICEGDNIVLSVEGADQYAWSPSQSLSSSIGSAVSASPLSSTIYTVIGTDSLGCIDSVQTTISVNSKPIADLTINDNILICTNDSAMIIVELSGAPPWEISCAVNNTLYNQINTFSNPSVIYGNIEGDYTIPLVIDGNNCSNVGISSVEVIRVNTPVADFDLTPQPTDVLNSEITFLNNSMFSDSWIWDFGDGYMDNSNFNTSHIFSDAGNYKVTLVVYNDICSDTIVHPLVIDPVYTIYVPDSFSPNNDGINDIFIPKGQSIDEFEMYIYNRWGEEVFYTENINIGWDGQNTNNSEIVVSTYTYIINITDELGVFHTLKGKIFLN